MSGRATKIEFIGVAMANNATEYSVTLPAGAVEFRIQPTKPTPADGSTDGDIRVSVISGGTDVAGAYWTVRTAPAPVFKVSHFAVPITGLTLYLKSDINNQAAEVMVLR